MASVDTCKTHLLSLPNELFPYLLDYLSAAEILKAFIELSERNKRLASLIKPYLSYVNLSHQSNFWLSTRLPKFKDDIYSVCATTRQLTQLKDLPSLHTLTIVDVHSTPVLERELLSLNGRLPNLRTIKVKFSSNLKTNALDHCITMPLEELDLSLRCSYIPTGRLIHSLRHLTVRVENMRDLFELGAQLPMVESLHIGLIPILYKEANHFQHFDSFIACSSRLKHLGLFLLNVRFYRSSLQSHKDFEYLERFIRGYASSLEYLTLDLAVQQHQQATHASSQSTTIIDGDRLEQSIIAFLPHLKQFDFVIRAELHFKHIPRFQHSFASESWKQRCTVVDYLLTPNPSTSSVVNAVAFSVNQGSTVSDDLLVSSSQIIDWHLNIDSITQRNSLVLMNIRSMTISLTAQEAILTLDLFRWTAKSFPRLYSLTLVRTAEHDWGLEDESVSYPLLKTIRKITLLGDFTWEMLRRILGLCPRLIYLVATKSILQQFVTEPALRHDQSLQALYKQIVEIELSGRANYFDFREQFCGIFPRASLV